MNHILYSIKLRLPGGALYERLLAAKRLEKKYHLPPFEMNYQDAYSEYSKGISSKTYKPYGAKFYEQWGLSIAQEHYDYLINDFYDIFLCDRRWLRSQNIVQPADYSDIVLFENDGPYQHGNVYIEENDVVIDAGANVGLFDLLAHQFKPSVVYAFEPVTDTFAQLQDTLAKNKLTGIVPIQAALSDRDGSLEISIDPECSGAASLVFERTTQTESIKTATLDSWVKNNNIKRIDFIKADIEGAERLLLEGGRDTIKTHKPKLALCTYHLKDDKEVLEKMVQEICPDYIVEHYAGKLFAYVEKLDARV